MSKHEEHKCPECGGQMIIKVVPKNYCVNTAEFPDAPCPGEDPTTHTEIEGTETEMLKQWYCPQCTITD